MGLEIERKYLLKNANWKQHIKKQTQIKQGYLNAEKERTVRVRVYGNQGFLTIKGKSIGATRQEFEYEIPLKDAIALMLLCQQPIIEKTRFEVEVDKKIWEIDVFEGENEGLTLAEIELNSEAETFQIPEWIGKEVTDDIRYFNSKLMANPFKNWKDS